MSTQGIGAKRCRVADPEAQGKNRCINTFLGEGYECQCGQGWVLSQHPEGGQSCEDLDKCRAVSISDPACTCERCACINTIGGYK